MIVWGGDRNHALNTGGRYSPDGNLTDADGDGISCDDDCNDSDPSIHPGAAEVCNGLDDDCDGSIDETSDSLCDDSNPCTTDTCGGVSGCSHAPALTLALTPSVLTPPNHKLVDVHATVQANGCASGLDVVLTSVQSSEPDDLPGPTDGHTLNDIQNAETGTPDFDFSLRAEADRTGGGRTYTVTYTAIDAGGNPIVAIAVVRVPLHGKNALPPSNPGDNPRKKPRPQD
jgi:hypothetical protein